MKGKALILNFDQEISSTDSSIIPKITIFPPLNLDKKRQNNK